MKPSSLSRPRIRSVELYHDALDQPRVAARYDDDTEEDRPASAVEQHLLTPSESGQGVAIHNPQTGRGSATSAGATLHSTPADGSSTDKKEQWCVLQTVGSEEQRICSSDFTHDVQLILTGDFADVNEAFEYALKIKDKLNGCTRSAVTCSPPVAWRRVFDDGTYDVFHGKPRESGVMDAKRWKVEPLFTSSAIRPKANPLPLIKRLMAQRDKCADALRNLEHAAATVSINPEPTEEDWQALLRAGHDAQDALADIPTAEQKLRNIAEGLGMPVEDLTAALARSDSRVSSSTGDERS